MWHSSQFISLPGSISSGSNTSPSGIGSPSVFSSACRRPPASVRYCCGGGTHSCQERLRPPKRSLRERPLPILKQVPFSSFRKHPTGPFSVLQRASQTLLSLWPEIQKGFGCPQTAVVSSRRVGRIRAGAASSCEGEGCLCAMMTDILVCSGGKPHPTVTYSFSRVSGTHSS